MNVKNRKCIRKLSLKSLYANRRRNLIAIFAIALTTLLFTSMFTIVLSLNASYETYQFRQVGGYAHGTFKDVSTAVYSLRRLISLIDKSIKCPLKLIL